MNKTEFVSFFNRYRNFWIAAALLLLCVVTYSNALGGKFMIDDHALLTADRKLHNLKTLYQYFNLGNGGFESNHSLLYYRPFQQVFLGFCYRLFQENTFGYHLLNLILFYFSCLVMYVMLNWLTKDWGGSLSLPVFFFVSTP